LDGRHHFTDIFPMFSIFLEATKTFFGGGFSPKKPYGRSNRNSQMLPGKPTKQQNLAAKDEI
jgi:hypothetical protein